MSEHTKTPWLIVPGKAFIYALDENGVNRFQASIDGAHCPESELVANARYIVHCVNNFTELVETLEALCYDYHLATGGKHHDKGIEVLRRIKGS